MSAPRQSPFGDDEAVYAAAVGPAWKEYYRPRFVAFAAGGPRVQWNWAAALVPFWSAYRKISSLGIALVVVFLFGTGWLAITLSDFIEDRAAFWTAYVFMILLFAVLQGSIGTWLYYRKVSADVRSARRRLGPAEAVARVAKQAPRRGLAQDVVHGLTALVLAGIGFVLVAAAASTSRMNKGGMRFHVGMALHGLTAAEQSWRQVHGRYTASLDSLGFRAPNGVVLVIVSAGTDSLRALGSFAGWEGDACAVSISPGSDTTMAGIRRSMVCGRRRRLERL